MLTSSVMILLLFLLQDGPATLLTSVKKKVKNVSILLKVSPGASLRRLTCGLLCGMVRKKHCSFEKLAVRAGAGLLPIGILKS